MFDMGFIADLRFILRRLPKPERRQSFLFSATLSFRVLELTWEFMNNPTQITITPKQKTVEKAEQVLYHVGREEKFNLLLGLLKREGGSRILIFSNTREEARRLEDRLSRNGWLARALTGDVDQKKRLRILADFKEGDAARAGRHRRRLARPAHRGREPRHQLGPAPGRGGLRPPHRPHRARRRGGQGDQPGRRGERALPRADRAVHRPEDPRRVGRRRALSGRRSSRPARSAAATPRRSASAWPPAAARVATARGGSGGRPGGGHSGGRSGEGRRRPAGGIDGAASSSVLPVPERVRAAGLAAEWSDFLYVPGRGFTSPIEPGLYRSSFVVALASGPRGPRVVLRGPRLRRRALPSPARAACQLPAREPRLVLRACPTRRDLRDVGGSERRAHPLAGPTRVELRRAVPRTRLARVATRSTWFASACTGGSGDAAFSWVADRGLALTGADGERCLLLANPDDAEQALLTPRLGFYAALLDPHAPPLRRADPRATSSATPTGRPTDASTSIAPRLDAEVSGRAVRTN